MAAITLEIEIGVIFDGKQVRVELARATKGRGPAS